MFRDRSDGCVKAFSYTTLGFDMHVFSLLVLATFASSIARAASPVPTVIVDVHARGHVAVATLKAEPAVRWSAEFGNELLLGVDAASLSQWLTREGVRRGPGEMAADEIVVRDHVCTLDDPGPALAVVGGYEIVRRTPLQVLATRGAGVSGEPLPGHGVVAREQANEPQPAQRAGLPDPAIAAIVARVDGERWFTSMSDLAALNRNSFSPALGSAHDWIRARFVEAGLSGNSFAFDLTATSCTPTPPTVSLQNPIGFKTGHSLPNEWIVVGAHYDSRNSERCDGTAAPQPGANDNASGCAGVIELARVFAQVRTARSLVFVCFAGEEQGLVGSRRYVEALQTSGDIAKVKHMINIDMMGHAIDDSLSARVETTTAQAAQLPVYAAAAATYAPELNLITSSSTQAYSDHWYFLAAGIPGAFTWENGAGIYPHYHKATDIPANMSRARPLAAGVLKMDAAVLAGLAGVPELFTDDFEF